MARTRGVSGDMLDRVAARLPDGPLVVALSGGPDSAALAWCVVELGRTARAVTIDHGLAHSETLVRAASEIAERLGLHHEVVSVPEARGEGPLRDLRLQALEAAARPDEVVVTGHTKDDQAETVLGNLLRGAGAAGLGGIPARRGRFSRPLLSVDRSETRALAEGKGLPFADDPDNIDPAVRRSRLRTQVMPFLEKVEGNRVGPALVRAGRLLRQDDALLADRAHRVVIETDGRDVRLPAASLQVLPRPIASRAARDALRCLLDPYPGSESDVDAVLDAAGGTTFPVSGGHVARREGPWVVIAPASPPEPPPSVALTTGSSVAFGRWTIDAVETTPSAVGPFVGRYRAVIATVDEPLEVRAAAAGDRIAIEAGSKPVKEVLREIGVPAPRRAEWPVVTAGGRMAWVVGSRVAAWARPGSPDRTLLTAREARWTSARR